MVVAVQTPPAIVLDQLPKADSQNNFVTLADTQWGACDLTHVFDPASMRLGFRTVSLEEGDVHRGLAVSNTYMQPYLISREHGTEVPVTEAMVAASQAKMPKTLRIPLSTLRSLYLEREGHGC
jgi:hypothetical protein